MKFTSRPELSAEISALTGLLMALSVDSVLTYQQASAAIGRNVQTSARFALMRAREEAEKEGGHLFATVSGKGIKKLPAGSAYTIGQESMRRIRRTAKRGVDRLSRVRGNMSEQEQGRITAYASMLGAVSLVAGSQAERAVEKLTEGQSVIPAGRILQILSSQE